MDPAVPIVAITATHIYEGEVVLSARFQEVLNESITAFLDIDDVTAVRINEPDVTLYEADSMTIAKDRLVATLITTDEHEAPKTRVTHRSPRAPQKVFICTEGVEIRGLVHLTRMYDTPTEAISLEFKPFFAVTDVSVTFPGIDGDPVQAPVALVNRNLLTALALED